MWPASAGDRATALKATGDKAREWGSKSASMARARKAVAAAYDELDPDLNPKERGKAQRNIRRHIRDSYALEYLPAASWKKGIAAPRYLISGAQGVGKTAAVVGAVRDGETKRGLMHEGSGLVTVLFSPDHAKSAEAFNDFLS